MCGRGGIGRRAALRSLWGKTRGSSSLLDRTICFLSPLVLSLPTPTPTPTPPTCLVLVSVGRYAPDPDTPDLSCSCRRWSLRSRPRHPRRLVQSIEFGSFWIWFYKILGFCLRLILVRGTA